MSRLILLANYVACWRPDPSQRQAHVEYVRNRLGLPWVRSLANGWVLGLKPLPRSTTGQVFHEPDNLVVLQGPATIAADTPAGARELRTAAERLRHRPHELGHHNDDFAFALLESEGLCAMVCTPATLPPLYFAQDTDALTVGSRLDWVAALRPVAPTTDPLPLALWSIGRPLHLDGRTVIRGIQRMRRGSVSRVAPRSPPRSSDLSDAFLGSPGAERSATREEVAATLRQQVLHKLETELVPDGNNLLSLSGGTDSSALAAVTRKIGLPFKAVSLLTSNPQRRERELTYICSALGPKFPQDWIDIPWTHREYQFEVLDKGPTILHPVLHPVLCELRDIQRQYPVEVYFGGEFCDELIGGVAVIPEWCADTSPWRAWRQTPVRLQDMTLSYSVYLRQRAKMAFGRAPLNAPAGLPRFVQPGLRREYRIWLAHFRQAASTSPAELPLQRWLEAYAPILDMNWEAASAVDVRRSFPLVSRDILGLLRRTAPALRLGPGPKVLFRMAVAEEVPVQNLHRADKGAFGNSLPLVPQPTWVLRRDVAEGIMSAGESGWYSLGPGMAMYAAKVIERYTNYIRIVSGKAMKQYATAANDKLEGQPLKYETPQIRRDGNLSVVTEGVSGGDDSTLAGATVSLPG